MAKAGGIPWWTPTDVERYERLAFSPGVSVLMGSRTYEQSIQHLGAGQAYVLTSDPGPLPLATVVHDLDAFLTGLKTDVWIIGGASVFEQTLGRADELYITEIEADFECDLFYPPYKHSFELLERSEPVVENDLHYTFCIYRPRR